MAHGQGSEQVVMVDDLSLPSSKWSLLKADPQIKQTQNNLQILISVLLTLSVIGTILTIVDSLAGYDRNISLRVASMVRPLLALILHGFGFSVTYRYNELGLLATQLDIIKMKHEQTNEQVAMIAGQSMPSVKTMSLTGDPKISRIRKILLLILGIFIALSAIRTIGTIVIFIIGYSGNRSQDAASIVPVLLTLLLEAFGFFVTYKYHELGLVVNCDGFWKKSLSQLDPFEIALSTIHMFLKT
ncbi:unnamed protein product [Rotaria socialis]|uniref:Uncharacterized protein n=2 Tax=Rotaria socialis TaxID=392032 RepID=A0A820P7Z9_9BILA|nr:unnamed protein product [Rotaria socialis]